MADYKTIALGAARKDGLTAEQVKAMGYLQIAALAGVKVSPSPMDFFYVNIRRYVAGTLRREEEAEAELARIESSLTKISPTDREWFIALCEKAAIVEPGVLSAEVG